MCIFKNKNKVSKVVKLDDKSLDSLIHIKSTEYDRGTKLTEDEVKEIRNLYNKGFSQKNLAQMFNVSQPTISYRISDLNKAKANLRRLKYINNKSVNDIHERAEYKRLLLKANKIKVGRI